MINKTWLILNNIFKKKKISYELFEALLRFFLLYVLSALLDVARVKGKSS